MEQPPHTLQLRHSHSVSLQLQQRISDQNLSSARVDLVVFTRAAWRTLDRHTTKYINQLNSVFWRNAYSCNDIQLLYMTKRQKTTM
jgi:hypothetical protein